MFKSRCTYQLLKTVSCLHSSNARLSFLNKLQRLEQESERCISKAPLSVQEIEKAWPPKVGVGLKLEYFSNIESSGCKRRSNAD